MATKDSAILTAGTRITLLSIEEGSKDEEKGGDYRGGKKSSMPCAVTPSESNEFHDALKTFGVCYARGLGKDSKKKTEDL